MAIVNNGEGFPLAILNRNKPAFYCISTEVWEIPLDKLEDIELTKLAEKLELPRIEFARLSSMTDCYKIKLKQVGYRLVYQVKEGKLVVLVLVVGKSERNSAYESTIKRI